MLHLNKEELQKRLEQLDTDASLLFNDEGRYHVCIAGSGALILMDYTSRATSDIDVINATGALVDLFKKYQMNTHIAAHINSFLLDYEKRVKLLWSGEKIDFFTVSLEDVVVSKLCAGRPSDLDDLKAVAVFVDWEKLEALVSDEEESIPIRMSDRQNLDFEYAYKRYVEEHRL